MTSRRDVRTVERAQRRRRHLDRALVVVVIIALWSLATWRFGTYWVSSPWAVAARFAETVVSGELVRHAGYTLSEAALGTLIGGVPAVLLPLALRRHPVLIAILDPFMIGGYGAPKLAFAPLFIVWFGIGMESKIALVVSVVFFIVYFTTLNGVRALDPKLVQMAQILGAGERRLARSIVLPAAVPSIFAGLRIAVPYGIAAAVIAELISANRGLGYLVQNGAMNFDTTGVFVAVLMATLMVQAAAWLMNALEAWLLAWRPPVEPMMESGA
ncbi:MAG: ABC transporter permease [Hyphomicrobiales bacterium]|nr:ABC transporter permease [Hyphomicrobiales bacterium]